MTTRSKVIDPYLMTLKLFDLKKLTFEILTSTQFVDLWNMTPFALRIWPQICDLGYWTIDLFMILLVWPLLRTKNHFTSRSWPLRYDLTYLTSFWWHLSFDLKSWPLIYNLSFNLWLVIFIIWPQEVDLWSMTLVIWPFIDDEII